MHGRIKIKTSREKELEAAKFRTEELDEHRRLWSAVNELRRRDSSPESDDKLLQLSFQLLSKNPDFYTLFNLRRRIIPRKVETLTATGNLASVRELFVAEDDFTQRCLRINPKSYGVWHHRRWVMLTMPEPNWKQELILCEKALDYDERNFHCWAYRRFVAEHGKSSPGDEFAFTQAKIESNLSNYSAWHYRSNLLPLILDAATTGPDLKRKAIEDEAVIVHSAMYTDPIDEAVWYYAEWLLHFVENHVLDADQFKKFLAKRREVVEDVISCEEGTQAVRRPLAMSLDLAKQFPTDAALDAEVVRERVALLCKLDSMHKNCYATLYGNVGN